MYVYRVEQLQEWVVAANKRLKIINLCEIQ